MHRRDPRLIGFLIGFSGVTLVGLIVVVGWALFNESSTPTLVPSAAPVSKQVTVAPANSGEAGTPATTSGDVATATSLPSPTELPPTPSPTPSRTASIEYTVREGDTLFDIALAYGVSIDTIQTANDLGGEMIFPSQVLIIPPGPLPTATPFVEDDAIVHTVSSGETLIGIAKRYSVTVETIQVANALDSEIIKAGWQLRIPVEDVQPTPPLPTTAPANKAWQPSILEGNLEEGYPLTFESEHFTMHYQPDTPAARAPNRVAAMVEASLDQIEDKLQVTMKNHFDVYVAGSLFASDDIALRGRSFSSQRRSFLLYDDTGTPDERRYVITHELTHLVVWNTLGRPSSVMLHEGLAVYSGVEALDSAGFIPLSHFCAAYQQADQLPPLRGSRPYLGHVRDLDLYFAAGCFVHYLIETYGLEDFKQLFTSGDYPAIYGETLTQLETEWIGTLETISNELTFDPDELVTSVTALADAYDGLFADFGGTPSQMAAYRELDQARIAVLQVRFGEAQDHLDEFEAVLRGE